MTESRDEWYEDIEIAGSGIRRVSKFSRKEFTVNFADIQSQWLSWTEEEHNHFAAAFACSPQDREDDNRQRIVVFLMERGDPAIWRKIALLIAKCIDRNRAVEFLVARVREGIAPLANYYQALAMLSADEALPALEQCLLMHRKQITSRLYTGNWDDRLAHLDYIACLATLFKITDDPAYEANLSDLLHHSDKNVREMVHSVANSMSIGPI